MEKIKKSLKERSSGLFLLILAVLIVSGISLNSHQAESKNEQNLASENQTFNESQILGEENNDLERTSNLKEENSQEETASEATVSPREAQEQEVKTDDTRVNSEYIFYDELKTHLKKYCGKNFNVKKCKEYLIEAKEARSKGSRFKELYKKYHFESKEEDKKDEKPASAVPAEDKAELVVSDSGSSKSYKIAVPNGLSVVGLMDMLQSDSSQNFSYHSSSGFIDKITGTENYGNMSWMLYVCKGDTCKLSNVGASDCKVDGWDKIEWKYLDWTTMDWSTW